jgi:hypothetical protein
MASKELLLMLSKENEQLRNQAAKSVEEGMAEILSVKRIFQKLSLPQDELESIAMACMNMMNAGIALRVMLQTHKRHHQRQESPWIDAENSTGHLLRTALNFENDAQTFASELRLALKETRTLQKNLKRKASAPEQSTQRAPASPSAPYIG